MSNITIGRYATTNTEWSGWIDSADTTGHPWIVFLDHTGRPAVAWLDGDPIHLSV